MRIRRSKYSLLLFDERLLVTKKTKTKRGGGGGGGDIHVRKFIHEFTTIHCRDTNAHTYTLVRGHTDKHTHTNTWKKIKYTE